VVTEATEDKTDKEEKVVATQNVSGGTVVTKSQYSESFRRKVGEDADVVFLGKPRDLRVEDASKYAWETSDAAVATVRDGVVTGWSEGVVTISQKQDGKSLQEWQFVVTTFNDGRQVELSYELGKEKVRELMELDGVVKEPAFWREQLNTVQDVLAYFQLSGFSLSYDLPILCTVDNEWIWNVPGDTILLENHGMGNDLVCAACYLLQDDYEEQGFIFSFGTGSVAYGWYYEDGFYYLMNYKSFFKDLREGNDEKTYELFKADSVDALAEHVISEVNVEDFLALLMISSQGHDYEPPYYVSYLHDTSEIYHSHVKIGLEDAVMKGTKVLFSNDAYDYELISVPTAEVPAGLPLYGENGKGGYLYK